LLIFGSRGKQERTELKLALFHRRQ
jgi:hypothetical protein